MISRLLVMSEAMDAVLSCAELCGDVDCLVIAYPLDLEPSGPD